MKKARLLSILMAGALVAVGAIAQAQQPAKIPRIGIIAGSKNVDVGSLTSEFRRALRDLGYIEGKSIFFEYRYREGWFQGTRSDKDVAHSIGCVEYDQC